MKLKNKKFVKYSGKVYDLKVSSKDHSYVVNGAVVHNSAGGSIISYFLDITELDPIKFDLLFERFLNEDRAKVSIPDIDTDFQASRRDEVKQYMENKYGINQVCSVGTYTNLKLRAAFKDIARQHNVPFEISNYITQELELETNRWFDLFKTATKNKRVKDFIFDNPGIIEDIKLIFNQPKSKSIHACATLILPDEKPIYEWIPIRKEIKNDEEIIVSEWEGIELETAGFLKEDILGIKQLDKYAFILDLIYKAYGEKIDLNAISLEDERVYELFKNGYNGDVFHFGSMGLTQYCKELRPDNIEDLIAAISLYRPGAIENRFHEIYIDRKEGRSEVEYWVGAEKVLNKTYAVIVYQEQVMQLCQVLGGLSLVEADDVRRAMVKKKYEALHQYKERFIPYYIENFGVSEEYATDVWESIDKASLYLFNRSHAAAYAITGYMGQWLKNKYPLQYWTAAFQFDDEDPKKSSISRYMNEIKHTDDFIKIMPPNINKSGETFTSDSEKFELYWSIGRVKQVGEKALQGIIEERGKNGEFFSFEEFLSRVEKRVANKAVVINLILAGAFDELENISFVSNRRNIIHKYFEFMGTMKDLPEEYNAKHEDYWWQIKQKEISGFGIIDYEKVIKDKTDFNISKFVDADGLKCKSPNSSVVIAGLINKCDIRKTKNKDEYCRISLDCNNQELSLIIWNDFFSQLDREEFYNRIVIFEGVVIKDSYKKVYESGDDHVIHSYEDSKIYFL